VKNYRDALMDFQHKIGTEPYLDLYDCASDLPCYCHRWIVENEINSKGLIEEYLKISSRFSLRKDGVELTMFSVTEEDAHAGLWLEVAAEKGLTIIPTHSKHRGRYKCWMILQHTPDKKIKA